VRARHMRWNRISKIVKNVSVMDISLIEAIVNRN
jgi:hypothetical protein